MMQQVVGEQKRAPPQLLAHELEGRGVPVDQGQRGALLLLLLLLLVVLLLVSAALQPPLATRAPTRAAFQEHVLVAVELDFLRRCGGKVFVNGVAFIDRGQPGETSDEARGA